MKVPKSDYVTDFFFGEMEGDTVSAERLLNAIRAIKAENPDFGIKRVWTTLTEKQGMVVSEKRVKKFMQDNGFTNAEGAGGGEGRESTAEQQKRNAREKQNSKTVNADSGKKASGSGSTKSRSIVVNKKMDDAARVRLETMM